MKTVYIVLQHKAGWPSVPFSVHANPDDALLTALAAPTRCGGIPVWHDIHTAIVEE